MFLCSHHWASGSRCPPRVLVWGWENHLGWSKAGRPCEGCRAILRPRQPVWLPQDTEQVVGRPWALLLGLWSQAGPAEQAAQRPQCPPQPGGTFLAGAQRFYTGRQGTERPLGAQLRCPELNPSLTRGRHREPTSCQTCPSSLSLFFIFTELNEAHSVPLLLLWQGLGPNAVYAGVLHNVLVTVIFLAALH